MKADYDVFLAHNSKDKESVKIIARELTERGIKYWLDAEEIIPGRFLQSKISEGIRKSKTAAIFIGTEGLGNWQDLEIKVLIDLLIEEKKPLIPVLLPGVDNISNLNPFLKQIRWVNFMDNLQELDALYDLEWGIKGKQPEGNRPRRVPGSSIIPIDSTLHENDSLIEVNLTRNEIENGAKVKVFLKEKEIIYVTIPPDSSNHKIRIQGKGQIDSYTGKRGDLYLRINCVSDSTNKFIIDYGWLERLLNQENWIQANRETKAILLSLSNQLTETEEKDWISTNEIYKIPCQDIFKIDNLWLRYSNNRFGFTIQKAIWEKLGGNFEYSYDKIREFGIFLEWLDSTKIPMVNPFFLLDPWLSQGNIEARLNQVAKEISELPQGYLPFLSWGYINRLNSTDWFNQTTDTDFFHSNFYIGAFYEHIARCESYLI